MIKTCHQHDYPVNPLSFAPTQGLVDPLQPVVGFRARIRRGLRDVIRRLRGVAGRLRLAASPLQSFIDTLQLLVTVVV